jgi:hypothetical protein
MNVPIEKVKRLAKELRADAVIVIAFRGCGSYATTSYGKDRATCEAFAPVCDRIHDDIANGSIPIPIPIELSEGLRKYCDRCDGCGWYEGGEFLQTTCEKCNGTGIVI